ncbi:hypothetical protein MLD38_008242 [Melastoma candidum]|uniref:Uncharacterized protein n=1 Tax=Melastoma candidum TaxID=119954 RepID=A0ACB9RTV3_9MYRT|nr:hypothetical protein MLD38_008242 [Melastoma candidum]
MEMELGSVVQFLEGKTVLVTGATGFLAKIFLEKVLRVQPNLKKLFLLLRAADAKAASYRFHNEVIGKDLFRVLKEKTGSSFSSLISEKVTLVPGDIAQQDLGIDDPNMREEMLNETDIVINLAATTKFDDRYDVAFGINTLGAKHVLEFAKGCRNLKVAIHVSTAYVCGEKEGLLPETPYKMGETLNGATGLDIYEEKRLIEDKLIELKAEGATDKEISVAMRDLGISRANKYGWPNTYVFTKTMGEMLVGALKGNLPVVILRPTIITSTYKEPFPGWTEGLRTVDSLAIGYGKGKLKCFLGDLDALIDVIPADMVVNCIMVAAMAHANRPSDAIYQIGSSLRNPVRYSDVQEYGQHHFINHPWINKDGQPVKVGKIKILGSMASFHRYMAIRYLPLLKGLEFANAAFCRSFQGTYTDLNSKIKFAFRMTELYRPYLFFKGVFDDTNTEALRIAANQKGVEADIFYFDPSGIDWKSYFLTIHIPGVVKYLLK